MTPGYKITPAAGLPPPDELVLRHGELVKRIAYHDSSASLPVASRMRGTSTVRAKRT